MSLTVRLSRLRGLLLISGLIGFARGRKIGRRGILLAAPSVVRVGPFHLSGQEKRRYDEGDAVARNERDGSLFAPQLLLRLSGQGWLRETALTDT